ncbi:MAG: hypothetical protein PVF37_17155, partial [Desulfobacterales bacterium]
IFTEIVETTTGDFGHISRYPKNKRKGGPQYVVSAIFLIVIGEVKIRTTNPSFFASVRSIN